MYESPITQIVGKMETKWEDDCFKVVQSYGFTVNKEELTKALQYDRGQYKRGYEDGYAKAIEEFTEQIKARAHSTERNDWSADYMISIWESVIDEIAMEMKGE
jgi:hypothetical protein